MTFSSLDSADLKNKITLNRLKIVLHAACRACNATTFASKCCLQYFTSPTKTLVKNKVKGDVYCHKIDPHFILLISYPYNFYYYFMGITYTFLKKVLPSWTKINNIQWSNLSFLKNMYVLILS